MKHNKGWTSDGVLTIYYELNNNGESDRNRIEPEIGLKFPVDLGGD